MRKLSPSQTILPRARSYPRPSRGLSLEGRQLPSAAGVSIADASARSQSLGVEGRVSNDVVACDGKSVSITGWRLLRGSLNDRSPEPMRHSLCSTRRLMALVAWAALVMGGLNGGRQPGLYYPVGNRLIGVCRNDLAGRRWASHGKPMGWLYQAGAWSAGDHTFDLTGLHTRDGRFGGKVYLYW